MQALELEAQQAILRAIQDGNPPVGAPPGTPLAMLSYELSRFLVDRLLVSRAAHRAAAARSLRLLPLQPTQSPRPQAPAGWQPFGRLLEAHFAKFPALRTRFPHHACFLAMPPTPASLPLWTTQARNRGMRSGDSALQRNLWPRMQFTIAVGLDPAGLQPAEAEEPGTPPGAPPGTRAPRLVRARMCAALVCSLTTAASGTRLITHIEPAPPQVFTGAQRLLDQGTDAAAVLAAVGRHSKTEAAGWFRCPEGAGAAADHGRGQKRPRSSDGGDAGGHNGVDTNGAVHKRARGADDVSGPGHGRGPPVAKSGTMSPESEREGMEVALMVGFLSTRALVCYLRAELDAMQAVFSEVEPLSGSINPLVAAPSQPTLQLKSLPYDSSGTSYTFPEKRVPWPLCVPAAVAGGEPAEDSSVSQVTVVVVSPTAWELHVESRYIAAKLAALQQGRPLDGKWALHPTRPHAVLARYSTLRSGRAGMHCWRDVLALLRTRDSLAALAIVHRPPANGAAADGAGGGIQPMHFPFGAYDVSAEVVALDRIRVAVVRASVAHVALTPPPTDVPIGNAILTVDVVCDWDYRVETRTEAAADGGAPRARANILLFVSSKAAAVSVAGGMPHPPGLQERLTDVLWTTLMRLDMSSFLDALTCSAEGLVELMQVAGGGQTLLADLTCVKRVELTIATAPTRLVVLLHTTTTSDPYAVGVLLKKQGVAMLQFDPRQFSTQADMGNSMGPKRTQRPRTLLEVPEWATISQDLLGGEAPVGRAAADVHVPWDEGNPNGANIAVPQRVLGDVIKRIARSLDVTLGHG